MILTENTLYIYYLLDFSTLKNLYSLKLNSKYIDFSQKAKSIVFSKLNIYYQLFIILNRLITFNR